MMHPREDPFRMRWGVLVTSIALVAVGVVLALTDLVQLGAPFDVESRMFGLVVGIGGIGLALYAIFARGSARYREIVPEEPAPPPPGPPVS